MVYKKTQKIMMRKCRAKSVKKKTEQLIAEVCSDRAKVNVILQKLIEHIDSIQTVDFEETQLTEITEYLKSRRVGQRKIKIMADIYHLTFKHDFAHDVTVGFSDVMQRKRCGNLKIVLVVSSSEASSTEKDVLKSIRLASDPQMHPGYSFILNAKESTVMNCQEIDLIGTLLPPNSMRLENMACYFVIAVYPGAGIKLDWNTAKSNMSSSIHVARICVNGRVSESADIDWDNKCWLLANSIEGSRTNLAVREDILKRQLLHSRLA